MRIAVVAGAVGGYYGGRWRFVDGYGEATIGAVLRSSSVEVIVLDAGS